MKRLRTKLRSSRGETLVEVLASILVAALSVGLLMAGIAVSVRINRRAEQADDAFYAALTAAEGRTAGTSSGAFVTVAEGEKQASLSVQVYGEEGLWSYALAPEGGDGP